MLAGALVVRALTPRERHEQAQAHAHALDTSELDELARTDGGPTSATSTTSASESTSESTPTSSPVLDSASAARLEELARAERPATSSPAGVPSHWVPVTATSSPTPATSSPTSSPEFVPFTDAELATEAATVASTTNDDSAREAARALHAYVMRTPSSRRDRQYIRVAQAAMGGGIAIDGLIGRGTAARIKELTGLRIPGLS